MKKYLFASDIHGSMRGWNNLKQCIEKENPYKIILLGDVFYHGIRNSLPDDYMPAKLLSELNAFKGKLISLIGNCDSEVDVSVAEFAFLQNYVMDYGGNSIFLSHGHRYNKNTPPAIAFDACIYGHEHVGYIKKVPEVGNFEEDFYYGASKRKEKTESIFACVGSVSMSKGGPECYMILDDALILKDMDGNVLDKCDL